MTTEQLQVQRIDFKRRRYIQATDKARRPVQGLYIDLTSGRYYERPSIEGRRSWFRLHSTSIRAATEEMFRRREELAKFLAREPGAKNPYSQSEAMTVADLCDFYVESGCPKRKSVSSPRTALTLKQEKTRVEWLKKWWGKHTIDKIELGMCDKYAEWRRPLIRRSIKTNEPISSGGRQIDKELVTLSQILWWAARHSDRTGVKENPLRHDRPRYCDPATVRHCREFQPENGDELHALARFLFNVPKSQVCGWHLLMEAMVGPRASEVLKLRWDAKGKNHAGFVARTREGRVLYLYNSTTTKGTAEHIKIHPALSKCLDALRKWHQENYPESPWFFPSPDNPSKPLGSTALTHALARITKTMGLPKRTSHGLRSYFVNVLRSRGESDNKIAPLIGQKSGGKLIAEVYGTVPIEELSWMPASSEPAWAVFEEAAAPTDTIVRIPRPLQLELAFPNPQLELVLGV